MKRLLVSLLLVVAVVSAGCAGLAGTGDDSTQTTAPNVQAETNSTATTNTPTSTVTSIERNTATETPSVTSTATVTQTKTATATETPTSTPTETPPETPTPTPRATETATPTLTETERSSPVVSRPDGLAEDENHVVVKAVGEGTSYYRIYVPGSIDFGDEADTEGEAEHPDRVISQVTTYIQGYVGDGGVDDYILDVGLGVIVNDGNTTLKVYLNGELYDTVEPGTNVDRYGPLAPRDLPPPDASQKVVKVEAVGEGNSFYILSSTEEMTLGQQADIPAEAESPDHPAPIVVNGINGNIGDGGVDTYRTTGNLDEVRNDGNATLKVYVDGELWATVEPNESVEEQSS